MPKSLKNTEVPVPVVPIVELGRHIAAKRKNDDLTLAEASEVSGVSAATLSRLERQSRGERGEYPTPETKTLRALSDWLRVRLDIEEGRDVVSSSDSALPDVLDVHLRADRKLSPEDAATLSRMFRAAYDQFSKGK